MQSPDPVAPQEYVPPQTPPNEPFIRLPPVTSSIFLIILLIQAGLSAWSHYSGTQVLLQAYFSFGFIPALLTTSLQALPTILTAGFLHGGWFHLGVNGAMLLACGSGVEKLGGRLFMLAVFIGGIIIGNLSHYALFPDGQTPLVGASGGISALFGAVLVLSVGTNKRRLGFWLLLFMALSAVQWGMGGPNGEEIGVFAHLGGFLYGLAAGLLFMKRHGS